MGEDYYMYYDHPAANSNPSFLAEFSATLSVLLGGFLAFLIVYIFGVCKNKNHNNFIMFNTLLITYDWIFYIIFTLWSYGVGLRFGISTISLTVLIFAVLLNTLLTTIILRRELNNNEQFRVWFQEHKAFGIFIAFLSLGNINVLHVLDCKFNYMDKFDAKLSSTAEKKIIHASVINLIARDIPQFIILSLVNLNLSEFYAIPIISLFLNYLVIFFGTFYRIYEATIRGYEKPTVQEVIVNKKQLEV